MPLSVSRSDIFFDHEHIADKIVYDTFQVLASFIRRFAVRTAQQLVHLVSKESAAGGSIYSVIILIQLHNHSSYFYLALQKCTNLIATVLRRRYKSAKCNQKHKPIIFLHKSARFPKELRTFAQLNKKEFSL